MLAVCGSKRRNVSCCSAKYDMLMRSLRGGIVQCLLWCYIHEVNLAGMGLRLDHFIREIVVIGFLVLGQGQCCACELTILRHIVCCKESGQVSLRCRT